jgi:hypothetical protein
MEPLWKMQQFIEDDDILAWRDEVGIRKVWSTRMEEFFSISGQSALMNK